MKIIKILFLFLLIIPTTAYAQTEKVGSLKNYWKVQKGASGIYLGDTASGGIQKQIFILT